MIIGTVRQWDIEKGYGFVRPDGGAGSTAIFVHRNVLGRCGIATLNVGDRVELEFERNPKDATKLRATAVALLPAPKG